MDADGLKELFEPFGAVAVKRLFGGHGVYAEGLCFAMQAYDEVYIKTDDSTKSAFAAAGSRPFVYEMKGRATEMSFWRLPEPAFDDPDELKRWAALGLAAARRAAAAKAKPARPKGARPAPAKRKPRG